MREDNKVTSASVFKNSSDKIWDKSLYEKCDNFKVIYVEIAMIH